MTATTADKLLELPLDQIEKLAAACASPRRWSVSYEDDGDDEEITADTLDEAIAEATEMAEDADWGGLFGDDPQRPSTAIFGIYVREVKPDNADDDDDADEWEGEESGRITITIDPPEPDCPEHAEHAWDERSLQGHGGGVATHDVCTRCGAGRSMDSWAQDPVTGEQGLESVSYEPPGTYRTALEEAIEKRRSECEICDCGGVQCDGLDIYGGGKIVVECKLVGVVDSLYETLLVACSCGELVCYDCAEKCCP